MNYNQNEKILLIGVAVVTTGFFASTAKADVAPAVPDLNLPAEEEIVPNSFAPEAPALVAEPEPAVQAPKPVINKTNSRRAKKATPVAQPVEKQETAPVAPVPVVEEKKPVETAEVLNNPDLATPLTGEENFEPARETKEADTASKKAPKVVYAPATDRDPTLSPMDLKEIEAREKARLRAIEMEKQRKLEAERQRLAELERLRQLELERLRDPSKEIRGKIRINGIIGQEVFIGNKVYTVGKTVLGARIVSIKPEEVVFMYKGQKFTKKVQLK